MAEKQDRYVIGSPEWRTTNNRDTARTLGGVLADREGGPVPVRDTRTGAEWSVAPDGRMTQTKDAQKADTPEPPAVAVQADEAEE